MFHLTVRSFLWAFLNQLTHSSCSILLLIQKKKSSDNNRVKITLHVLVSFLPLHNPAVVPSFGQLLSLSMQQGEPFFSKYSHHPHSASHEIVSFPTVFRFSHKTFCCVMLEDCIGHDSLLMHGRSLKDPNLRASLKPTPKVFYNRNNRLQFNYLLSIRYFYSIKM